MNIFKIIVITVAISSFFTACKKDSSNDNAPKNNNIDTINSKMLFSVITGKIIDTMPLGGYLIISTGQITTIFNSINIGTLKLDSINLPWYVSSSSADSGHYSTDVNSAVALYNILRSKSSMTWHIGGNNSNHISAFDETVPAMPKIDSINSSTVIPLGSDYTLTCTSIQNSDFVTYTLEDANKNKIEKTFAGNVLSATFTSAEISTLLTGKTTAEIQAIHKYTKIIDNKKYNFDQSDLYIKNNMMIQ